jgi:anti-sigma B factor antagonist
VLAGDLPGGGTGAVASSFTRLRSSLMSQASTASRPSADLDRGHVIRQVTGRNPHLALPARTERGYLIAALSGGLDATRVPAVREQLLRLLRPAASRLVLDLALVSHIDAGGLAVLIGTERRARLLGGCLRLAAVRPAVSMAVRAAGLDRLLEIFPTVQSAVSSPPRARSLLGPAGEAEPAS